MSNRSELDKIKAEMEANTSLPLYGAANLVFGVGNANTDIVFIGEAPGAKEDELREPFVGRAGTLLNKLFEKYKLSRKSVYITNIVKRRPPENRDPLPEEIEAYKPFLKRELQTIKPKIIATLGRFSMNYFLPNVKISASHGKIFRIKDTLIYPLYHPAAALRATAVLAALEDDFSRLPKMVKDYAKLIANE